MSNSLWDVVTRSYSCVGVKCFPAKDADFKDWVQIKNNASAIFQRSYDVKNKDYDAELPTNSDNPKYKTIDDKKTIYFIWDFEDRHSLDPAKLRLEVTETVISA